MKISCRPAGRCRELVISTYLTKPVRRAELRAAIIRALPNQQGRESQADAASRTPVGPLLEERAISPSRILLAEDNVVNQRLAFRILENRGHSVVIASNGREVLNALQEGTIDLILMDVQMPEIDGFEATKTIRKGELGRNTHIPIIAMTAHALTGDREKFFAAGMDGYLSKPIRARDLLSLVEKDWAFPTRYGEPGLSGRIKATD